MPLSKPRIPRKTAKEVLLDQKGKVASWDGTSDDALDLKLFVENGRLEGLTPKKVMEKYTQFDKYAYGTFSSALGNARKSFNNTVFSRGAAGVDRKFLVRRGLLLSFWRFSLSFFCLDYHADGGLVQHNNLHAVAEADDDDDDDEEYVLGDELSRMSMDDYSYDTRTIGYESAHHQARLARNGRGNLRPPQKNKKQESIYGTTAMGLHYIIDKWHDTRPQGRISAQVLLPSGNDVHKTVEVRVSTDQLSLVVSMPMSPYLARPDYALNSYLVEEWPNTLGAGGEPQQGTVTLDSHPKVIARKLSVAKIREREATKKDLFYE
jgi:hypothetical protein